MDDIPKLEIIRIREAKQSSELIWSTWKNESMYKWMYDKLSEWANKLINKWKNE